jgi:steroid delta-isomerase-like uncharacterized protein
MTTPEVLVGRFYAEIWNRLDLDVVPAVLAPAVTFRGSLGAVRTGHAEFIAYLREVTDALADYRCDTETLVVQGNQAAARMVFTGVHRAPFQGFPPTGRRVSWAGAAFFTCAEGLITDIWVLGDLQGLHAQLR